MQRFKASRGDFMTLLDSSSSSSLGAQRGRTPPNQPHTPREGKRKAGCGETSPRGNPEQGYEALHHDARDSSFSSDRANTSGMSEGSKSNVRGSEEKMGVQRAREMKKKVRGSEEGNVRGSGEGRHVRGTAGRKNGVISTVPPGHSGVVTIHLEGAGGRSNGVMSEAPPGPDSPPPAKKPCHSYVPEPPLLTFTLADFESQESLDFAPATPPSKATPTDEVTTPTIANSGPPLQPIHNIEKRTPSARFTSSSDITVLSSNSPISAPHPPAVRVNGVGSTAHSTGSSVGRAGGGTRGNGAAAPAVRVNGVGSTAHSTGSSVGRAGGGTGGNGAAAPAVRVNGVCISNGNSSNDNIGELCVQDLL